MAVSMLPVDRKFPLPAELLSRINAIIHEYNGEIGTCEVIGVLEIIKHGLINIPLKEVA
ncbi:hypothetical protein [Yersinia enterocolitica]|uniref:hypothetical protein n=1 Tax=Yersinia enterocolitica TaxID=630 RepID=UPI001F5A1100|nr:hypothetical protein [Yersinia enterocolitica]HDL7342396.1 hypothetical protein [Yersinia enterocolitica]HDL7470118.1 hypothetical protein [Yersinia enterocolitica]HDL7490121.1 hypothetical protein [Yersinia enterocolitica]HDL7920517.1 hypothetical protein [Yersinia enterocolitica]HDV5951122.1 hypothetical protein [Yersinia enterocolitica]